jgi:hypothetical protein
MGYEVLKGYTPEPTQDSFDVLKGNYVCKVNSARFEDYAGDNQDFIGVRFFRYELEVVDGDKRGRRLWGSYNTSNDTALKKLYDNMFAVGMTFDSEEELQGVAEKIAGTNGNGEPKVLIKVNAWGWTPETDMSGNAIPVDERKERQMHVIKGTVTNGAGDKGTPSF